jgi:hypothetical protein
VVRAHLLTLPSGSKPTSNEMNRLNSAETVRKKTLGERRMGPGLARPDLPGLAARLAAKNISNQPQKQRISIIKLKNVGNN